MDRMKIDNKPRLQQMSQILCQKIDIDAGYGSARSARAVLSDWVNEYKPTDKAVVYYVANRVRFLLEDWTSCPAQDGGEVMFQGNRISQSGLIGALSAFRKLQTGESS